MTYKMPPTARPPRPPGIKVKAKQPLIHMEGADINFYADNRELIERYETKYVRLDYAIEVCKRAVMEAVEAARQEMDGDRK